MYTKIGEADEESFRSGEDGHNLVKQASTGIPAWWFSGIIDQSNLLYIHPEKLSFLAGRDYYNDKT